jgi:hypothetical protein
MIDLHSGDAVKWALEYSGEPFHAALMDAPYEMEFMGKDWDGSGVAFDPKTWRAFAKVLHPGAFLMVFAGTINDDLISCAMREAGLRKFHKMMGWVYGSGFPKASRVNHGHPATETFKGHRYGLQALKPAIETVLIFQKPYEGKPIDNITQTGAGVLNVDGGRIATDERQYFNTNDEPTNADGRVYGFAKYDALHKRGGGNEQGRWPANFYLDAEAARRLDEQSGERPTGRPTIGTKDTTGDIYGKYAKRSLSGGGDTGGASRFFFRVAEQLDDADPVRYMAKASRSERDAGLDGFEEKITSKLDGGNFVTHGRTADTTKPLGRNPHPTVKPLALARYLATLLLPPVEYAPRRLFVPFAGVASECIGAMQAGWEQVTGVELTEEYIPIARARVEYWQSKTRQTEFA